MIRKVSPSKLDKDELSKVKLIPESELEEFDFSKVVVKKPWGYEYASYLGQKSSIWNLHMDKNQGTSFHCHPKKTSLIAPLSKEMVCSTLDNDYYLEVGDCIILGKGVFHRLTTVSNQKAIIMEIETPPIKTDLVRTSDAYGRERKAYESTSEMDFETDKYQYIPFDGIKKKIGEVSVSIQDDLPDKSLLKISEDYNSILINIDSNKILKIMKL